MPRPASIKAAVKPAAIHDVRGRGRMAVYGLADAKNALQVPLDDSHNDDDLLLLINSAQAFIEKATGLYLAQGSVDIDWSDLPASTAALEIPLSDVVSITTITEYSADGTAEELDATDYESFERRGRYYIARTDGCYFHYGKGLSVRVRLVRGLDGDTADAELVRVAMNYAVREFDKPDGMTRLGDLRNNQAFQRVLKTLQANVVQAGAF